MCADFPISFFTLSSQSASQNALPATGTFWARFWKRGRLLQKDLAWPSPAWEVERLVESAGPRGTKTGLRKEVRVIKGRDDMGYAGGRRGRARLGVGARIGVEVGRM